MRNVMMKAQELAQAILDSGVYQKMHDLEQAVTTDPAATAAISDYMEKRGAVEAILRGQDMDTSKLAEAGKALSDAEAVMNACPMVQEMRSAQEKYQTMMENINRILRLVVTGETEDGGCSGNCASCGGCSTCGGCDN